MQGKFLLTAIACAAFTSAARADYKVEMNSIDTTGVGPSIGSVAVKEAAKGGVEFVPDLKNLPPGTHGFHVHASGNCGPKEKDGKMEAGEMAGPHWDPDKAGKHGSPKGGGHRGDLPPLNVQTNGTAKGAIVAPRLKLADLEGKSLIVHDGGDNFSDKPKPNGGGGMRMACGVIGTAAK